MMDNAMVRSSESGNQSLTASTPSLSLSMIPEKSQGQLLRMFTDPRVLAKQERAELVKELQECVARCPEVSELRVVYGMALCVNLQVQEAMEEMGEAVSLDPHSYIAHLKSGELWMRLRVCTKAADHTHQASLLAQNLAQAELARRQAAEIRSMMQGGIERGGYTSPFALGSRLRRLWNRRREERALSTVDVG